MSKLGEGLKSSGANLSDYPKATEVMVGLVERSANGFEKRWCFHQEEQVEAVKILGQVGRPSSLAIFTNFWFLHEP